MIKYERAQDIDAMMHNIIDILKMHHIKKERVIAMRSRGSASKRTLARCHTFSRIIQKALDIKAHYIIEVISEEFDKLSEEDKIKTLIHELMHVPKSMGGGFKHHGNYVTRKNVEIMYKEYIARKSNTLYARL